MQYADRQMFCLANSRMLQAMAELDDALTDLAGLESFEALQERLGPAWAANKAGSGTPHLVMLLPSFSVGESLLSHYANRIPALEHRYLVACLVLLRIHACEMVFVASQDPGAEILDYYLGFVPPHLRREARRRFRVCVVNDLTPRSVAAKLIDRPDLLRSLRSSVGGRPAFIEPGWNVGENEVAVATALGVPINGPAPELWPLGFKSAGRRVFAEAGVPAPIGVEDVRSVADAVAAVETIRRRRPHAAGAVLKHDESGGGDGNAIIHLYGVPDAPTEAGWWIRQQIMRKESTRTSTLIVSIGTAVLLGICVPAAAVGAGAGVTAPVAVGAVTEQNAVTEWAGIIQPAIHNASEPRSPGNSVVLHTWTRSAPNRARPPTSTVARRPPARCTLRPSTPLMWRGKAPTRPRFPATATFSTSPPLHSRGIRAGSSSSMTRTSGPIVTETAGPVHAVA